MSKQIAGYRKGRPLKYKVDWSNISIGQEVYVSVGNDNPRTISTAITAAALRYDKRVSCSTIKLPGFVSVIRIK